MGASKKEKEDINEEGIRFPSPQMLVNPLLIKSILQKTQSMLSAGV